MPKNRKRPAVLVSRSPDGKARRIAARNEDGSIEMIEGDCLEEGQAVPVGSPIYSVQYEQDEHGMSGHTIETIVEGSRDSKGPARVTSPKFRRGYDAVFGTKKKELLN